MLRIAIASVLLGCTRVLGDEPRIEYTLLLDAAATQNIDVSMTIRGVGGPSVDVCMPAWRPGRYSILNPAGTVSRVRARDGAGGALACEKLDKGTWRVETGGADEVIFDYRVYANSLGDRTRHADDTHAFISPSTVLMYCPDRRGEPARVRVVAPEGWGIATGLEPEAGDPRSFIAPDYDVLVDSPLEVGLHDRMAFEVDGVPHEIVVWTGGAPPLSALAVAYDREKLAKDYADIVRVQSALFGGMPYTRYVFIVHCVPGASGGTEHLNSCVAQIAPSRMASKEGALGLISHEYFHVFNVKQLRPAGLKPYDYQNENYTRLLWVAEGTTTYYGGLTLVRAGKTKPDEYLKSLGTQIDALRRRPGAGEQSVEDSSFDAWVKFNHGTPDSVNTTVSFYDKGSLVSLLLDMRVRSASGGAASLDDVMRDLYTAFPLTGPGYTTQDLRRAAEARAGADLGEFFAKYVGGTEALPLEAVLGTVGLELVFKPADEELAEETPPPHPTLPPAPKLRASIGLTAADSGGLATVSTVLADGPAHAAGVIAGDVLVALNGQRVRSAELDGMVKKLKPGDAVRLTLLRYDREKVVEFAAGGVPDGAWVVRRIKDADEAQRAEYAEWLGQTWEEGGKKGGEEKLDDGGAE